MDSHGRSTVRAHRHAAAGGRDRRGCWDWGELQIRGRRGVSCKAHTDASSLTPTKEKASRTACVAWCIITHMCALHVFVCKG